jgi:CRP/FNR family transcriptional regulator, cyclic AMP receptor protein
VITIAREMPADSVELAIQRSVVAGLSRDHLDALLSGGMRLDIPAGSVVYREGDAPRCGLLVSGLARVFLVGPDGRQVTIRYMRPGSLSGSSLIVLGSPADARVQAVTDVAGLLLNVAALRTLARSDANIAWALAQEVARSQDEIMHAFAIQAFGTLRQRLARALLDLAATQLQVGQMLMAIVIQQELADAVGSSREAVARVLRELRADGLIDTTRGGVALLDPARLESENASEYAV